MNNIYDALRALLRSKELEIKKLEKEIEALRIVLPIVAEANQIAVEPESPSNGSKPQEVTTMPATSKVRAFTGPEFENVLAQVTGSQSSEKTSETPSKTRSSWP